MNEHEIKNIQYYDSNAELFKNSTIDANMNGLCDTFLSFLSPGARILDLGCGTGRDSLYFSKKGFSVLPVDGSKEMCRLATEISGIMAEQICFEDLEFDQEFDAVWACASLLHVDRDELPVILQKINRALKPSGLFYMSFKYGNTQRESNGRYFTDMTEKDISYLCNSATGFSIVRVDVSEDVRQERKGERWLNIIARK